MLSEPQAAQAAAKQESTFKLDQDRIKRVMDEAERILHSQNDSAPPSPMVRSVSQGREGGYYCSARLSYKAMASRRGDRRASRPPFRCRVAVPRQPPRRPTPTR